MPALTRCVLVIAASIVAWRAGLAGWSAALTLLVLAVGAALEGRLSGRLARLAARQPERGDLPTAPAVRWYPWLVGGSAALAAALGHPSLLGEAIPRAVIANLLAVAYPIVLRVLHDFAWPETALLVSRAWRHRVAPGAVAELVRAHTLAVPKCGVLTVGQPRLAGVHPLREGAHTAELLTVAAGLLAGDRSPGAEAVRQAAYATGLLPPTVEDLEPLPGLGVRGRIGQRLWSLGTRPLAAQLGYLLDAAADTMLTCQTSGGAAWVLLDEAGPVGWIELTDPLRREAPALLENLRAGGAGRLVLLSDDEPAAAEKLRRTYGFDEALPRQSPARLAELIRAWSADGPVVVLGRPHADAALLTAADVPVALLGPQDEPVGGLWIHLGDIVRLAVPWLAARGVRRRTWRLQRRLLPALLLVLALACAGAPLVLVVLLDELLVLAVLAAAAARTAPARLREPALAKGAGHRLTPAVPGGRIDASTHPVT